MQKLLTFFSPKKSKFFMYIKFENLMSHNDTVCFEQPGPEVYREKVCETCTHQRA